MLYLYARITNWLRREEGQDLIEYALLAGLIALAAVAALILAGEEISTIWNSIVSALREAPAN